MPLLQKLLPVVDDFKRAKAAIEQGGDISSLLKGLIDRKRLLDLLEQKGCVFPPRARCLIPGSRSIQHR